MGDADRTRLEFTTDEQEDGASQPVARFPYGRQTAQVAGSTLPEC